MKKCLLLTRVSTKYQDFTPQEEDLKKYANDLGYEVAGIISTKESGFRTIERKDGFKQVKEFFLKQDENGNGYINIFHCEKCRKRASAFGGCP